MIYRLFKRFVIGLVCLSFVAGVTFFVLYLKAPDPTCSDGKRNQGEEETDCGGPCVSCEMAHTQPIKVEWSKMLANRSGFYDVVIKIKNPNLNYGSGNIPYKISLYGKDGGLLSEYSGKTFILPNQSKYLLRNRISSPSPIDRVEVTFSRPKWQRPGEYQSSQLVVRQKEYKVLNGGDGGFGQVSAIIANRTSFDWEKVEIDVLLFDSFNNLLAVGSTEIHTFLTGEDRDFVVKWYEEINGKVSFIEIEPETNIFDEDNYLPTSKKPEQFQEY